MSHVNSDNAGRRRALAALALLLGVLLAPVLAPSATAQALPPEDDAPTEIFTGRVMDVVQIPGQTAARDRLRLTVQVILVYGETTVDTESVIVHTTANACATFPQGQETQRYLFRLNRQANGLVAKECSDIVDYAGQNQDTVVAQYGEPRSPVEAEATPTAPPPLDPVSYTCPDTNEAIGAFDASADCDALSEPASTDRASARPRPISISSDSMRRSGASSTPFRKAVRPSGLRIRSLYSPRSIS